MLKHSSLHMKFAQCATGSRVRTWFVAEEEDDFRLLQLKDEKWAVRTPDWPICSVCGVDRGNGDYEVLALGIDGELLVGTPGSFTESHVDPVANGPERYGVLRDIRWAGPDVFVVGMSRQVYRRTEGVWSDVAGSIRKSGGGPVGFNSVHGLSPDAVFAVGFGGEVWFFAANAWRQLDSPTSVALQRVLVLPSGFAVMCGAGGVILQGDSHSLVPVLNRATTDNLYGLAYFRGRLFISSTKALYAIGSSGLEPVDTGIAGPLSFGNLDANADCIWSVGARHLLVSEDGVKWRQVICDV